MQGLHGIYAALITPLDREGKVDYRTFGELVDFIAGRGVQGLCIGGGTGEYPFCDISERKALLRIAKERAGSKVTLISAIGSGPIHKTLELGQYSISLNYDALLVPPPYGFRLQQQDMEAFYRRVIGELDAPILIYHYPHFGNGLELPTIQKFFHLGPKVIGLKDSSGVAGNIEAIGRMEGRDKRVLLMGNDLLIHQALQKGWQGAISGVASLCPEILCAVYDNYAKGDIEASRKAQEALDELIVQLDSFPFPWAMHLGLPLRGIQTGLLSQELSPERKEQAVKFADWFPGWLKRQNYL